MLRAIVIAMLLAMLPAMVGCGDSESASPAPSTPDAPDVPVQADVADTTGPLPGPPCATNAECAGVFASMGPCEIARCVDDGYCVRAAAAPESECDDGNPCTTASACDAMGACRATATVDCPDRPCAGTVGCSPADGLCHYTDEPDDTPCDDGNECTVDDRCVAGSCVASYAPERPGCSCARDADCPAPSDACAGAPSCQAGQCVLLPVGGVACDTSLAGPCESVACDGGACIVTPREDGTVCDDGNACTVADACQDGQCTGGTNSCACRDDSECAQFDDDNLCNGSLACIGGQCTVSPGTIVTCQPSDIPCTSAVCQPGNGLCVVIPAADGVSCDDGDACTVGDACQTGECVGAAPAACGPPTLCEGEACHPACLEAAVCDSELGCPDDEALRLTGPACDDGLKCFAADRCVAGACLPGETTLTCDDGNPCTIDYCDNTIGCTTAPADGACDDGDPCSVDDQCVGGACVGTSELACDDGNPCTTGFCAAGSGCAFVFNSEPCDDGDPCTEGDICQSGQCRPGDKVCPCNEDANCTVAGGGTCAGVWHCIANQCVLQTNAAAGCAPAPGPCWVNGCDPVTGTCQLSSLANGSPCTDGDACTAGDVCQDGSCVSSTAVTCDDGNACTTDSCDSASGCVFQPNTAPCDDGDECTIGDACKAGKCTGSMSVCECGSDGDCDQPLSLCDGITRCVAGVCVADFETAVDCSDLAGPCQQAYCNGSKGTCTVVPKAHAAPCEDGDECTVGDLCIVGSCIASALRACDDGNPCTADGCDPLTGCTHLPVAAPCNDGNACTTDDTCIAGVCTGQTSLCLELCDNGVDDDGDGAVDCADAQCAEQPGCDACAVAPFVQCGAAGVPGAVGDDAEGLIGTTGCGDGPFPERIYRFTSTESGPVAITLLQGEFAYSLRVLTAGEEGGCDLGSCKASGSEALFTAAAGKTYHVVVEKLFLGGPPNFVLSVTCANQCVPVCGGAVNCGPDGCGGSCGSCDDGDPCTQDLCEGGQCASIPIEGCCVAASDCDDGNICTVDTCQGGVCVNATAEGCCLSHDDCDDGTPCTEDLCSQGQCVHAAGPGCCVTAADCDDGDPCTNAICHGGGCFIVDVPGCCHADVECQTGNPCTIDTCVDGVCMASPIPNCCGSAADCDDADPCTIDACYVSTLACVHTPVPGCCANDGDCPGADACLEPRCVDGSCALIGLTGCCYDDADCGEGPACTSRRCVGNLCVTDAIPGCCTTDGQCDDGLPCTEDACVAGQCSNLTVATCCASASDCGDGDPCTLDTCSQGQCVHQTLSNCCTSGGDCDDGDPCTRDLCTNGVCSHKAVPGCCEVAGDCGGGSCLTAACVANRCEWTPIPGCCSSADQCQTPNACVGGSCVGGLCELTQQVGCCISDDECAPPGDPCKVASCVGGKCVTQAVAACCVSDDDCPGGADPCSQSTCIGHACVPLEVDGCCGGPLDCASGDACANPVCAQGACSSASVDGCCSSAADCPAPAGGCQVATCTAGICGVATVPGCCEAATDCAAGSACDVVDCVLGKCVVTGSVPGCCQVAGDCPLPSGSCQQRACLAGQCVAETISGCCVTDAECPEPADGCQAVWCDGGQCRSQAILGCCAADGDCSGGGSPCHEVRCVDGTCLAEPADDCCLADVDCPASSDPCAASVCDSGTCTTVAVDGCCSTAQDCPIVACAEAVCEAGQCLQVPQPGCCTKDVECPEDPDPCTVAQCQGGKCVWSASAGCCAEDSDCAPNPDPCAVASCEAGGCQYDILADCAVGTCLLTSFDFSSQGWTLPDSPSGFSFSLQSLGAFSGSGVLHTAFGTNVVNQNIEAIAPAVRVEGETRLRFRYRLQLASGDCGSGALSVRIDGQSAAIWETCTSTSGWRTAVVDLSAWQGQTITARIRLATGTDGKPGQAWLDDAAFSGACHLTCDGDCNDGDPCTIDQCTDGVCDAEVLEGCCATDLACDDQDPCSVDECTAGGQCEQTLVPGCTTGACVATTFGPDDPPFSQSSTKPSFSFAPSSSGSYSAPSHLVVTSTASDAGHSAAVNLPQLLVAAEPLTLQFALRQQVGAECELGRVRVIAGDTVVPMPCGSHGWLVRQVPLPSSGGAPLAVTIRFDAEGAGGKVELDDVRITGTCQPVGCLTSAQCDDENPCTIDACDAGYACQHLPRPGCCVAAADCPSEACAAPVCTDGTCTTNPIGDCSEGTCAFQGFEGVGDIATLSPMGGSPYLGWELSPDAWGGLVALRGYWNFVSEEQAAAGLTAQTTAFRVFVGDAATQLRFRYRADFPSADSPSADSPSAECGMGNVELRIGGRVVWVGCATTSGWVDATVPLGASVGTVVSVAFRLRAADVPESAGEVLIDDLAVVGACHEVGCSTNADCDDGTACTYDTCLGLQCVYQTNELACDDGDACTGQDHCSAGACVGTPKSCDDGNPCTEDACHPLVGCTFHAQDALCDDGDPCTAGDACQKGQCRGAPLLCKDLNPCTRDGCTDGEGCLFEPEPYGTVCTTPGGVEGACWNGECAAFDAILGAHGVRLRAVDERTGPTPIQVVGDTDGHAVVYTLDQNTSALLGAIETPSASTWNDVASGFFVGNDGVGRADGNELELGVSAGLHLRTVTVNGSVAFIGGDGDSLGAVTSTLRRCKAPEGTPCQVMPVVHSAADCGKQQVFHINDLWAPSAQQLFVVGTSVVTPGSPDMAARVAVWDGNTSAGCSALGVYSGEVYWTGPGSLTVDHLSGNAPESFLAIDGASGGAIWVGGTGGMLYRLSGTGWLAFDPGVWVPWSSAHTVRGLVASADELHVVGDGVGVGTPGCRTPFYLHLSRSAAGWAADRYVAFHEYADCGEPPFDRTSLRDVMVDGLTSDLYMVGWAPGEPTRALLLRMEKP